MARDDFIRGILEAALADYRRRGPADLAGAAMNLSGLERAQEFIDCEVWWIEEGGIPVFGPYVDINSEVADQNQAELIAEHYGADAELTEDLEIVGDDVVPEDARLRLYGGDVGRSETLFDEANALAMAVQAFIDDRGPSRSYPDLEGPLAAYVDRWTPTGDPQDLAFGTTRKEGS